MNPIPDNPEENEERTQAVKDNEVIARRMAELIGYEGVMTWDDRYPDNARTVVLLRWLLELADGPIDFA